MVCMWFFVTSTEVERPSQLGWVSPLHFVSVEMTKRRRWFDHTVHGKVNQCLADLDTGSNGATIEPMKTYKRVHFIGIGGIGMSAMAKLLKAHGTYVSGSDVRMSETIKELRHMSIQIAIGSKPELIGKDVELIVYSSAVPLDDEERIRGRHLDIPEITYNAFLGEVSRGMNVIAVTGTHGKSTTTAMLGHMLIQAGLDPTVVVGSKVTSFKHGNLHIGKSDVFVAEACEHMAHMLHLDPTMIVLTNIEFDHPDYYQDVEAVRAAMLQFVQKLPKGGTLIWNADDAQSRLLVKEVRVARPDVQLLSYGEDADFRTVVEAASGVQTMHVYMADTHIGDVKLQLPGTYNVANAMMASLAASSLRVSGETIRGALEEFPGLWRRFEKLGLWQGAVVYTDYGHHPTALANLLEGVKAFLPNKRIVLCFQPHQHARTRGLFAEFVQSMEEADVIVLPEIYDVAGRNEVDHETSSAELVQAIDESDERRGVEREVVYAKDLETAGKQLASIVRPGDVLLMVGAGDIDGLARELVADVSTD